MVEKLFTDTYDKKKNHKHMNKTNTFLVTRPPSIVIPPTTKTNDVRSFNFTGIRCSKYQD